jgi:hypothetical protein
VMGTCGARFRIESSGTIDDLSILTYLLLSFRSHVIYVIIICSRISMATELGGKKPIINRNKKSVIY